MPYKDRTKRLQCGKRWRDNNQEKVKAAAQRRQNARKMAAFRAYGGAECVCCHEATIEFLSIDHVNGGGTKHRLSIKSNGRGNQFYSWLKQHGYPPGFRVLCMNCNFALGHFGYCPHGGAQKTLGNIEQPPLSQLHLLPDGSL